MHITLRNSHRVGHPTGYGWVNQGLADYVVHSQDEPAADVHLFASPPYNFLPLDKDKFNVGLTMCDKPLVKYDNFDFVGLSNQMDLLLVPGRTDKEVFERDGITAAVKIVRLGHEHKQWEQPIIREENKQVLIFDRGRDRRRQTSIVKSVFGNAGTRVHYCSGHGSLTIEQLKTMYREADVFVKWAQEYGWSYPALEAMSAGCLVISNCPYQFTSPDNSLTFTDAAGLTKALESCKTHTYIEKKRQAQKDVSEWTWERAAEGIIQAIKEGYESCKRTHG